MLHIRIIAVGNLKEKYWVNAVEEYTKRLTRYCKFEIVEVRESNTKDETAEIRKKIKGKVILCAIGGSLLSSTDLATRIETMSQTTSAISIVIGGSDGVGDHLDDITDFKISFGKITLPHQLFRVILTEQIYRAFTITKGEKYHK